LTVKPEHTSWSDKLPQYPAASEAWIESSKTEIDASVPELIKPQDIVDSVRFSEQVKVGA
jgi:hypothetical protein